MIAVLTGDIINSRKENIHSWLPLLKELLDFYGKDPLDWEIFRGDSFQLVLPPESALNASIHLKAGIKQIKELDVRIGIGIGELEYEAHKVSEANGSAFVRSGECFENLKKNTLGIHSNDAEFDETLNLLFSMAMLTVNNWSPTVAKAIKISLENPQLSQIELADLLQRTQSSLSEALKRGGFEEIKRLVEFYKKRVKRII